MSEKADITVLVVDDEIELRGLIAMLIQSDTADVLQAEDGLDALEKIAQFPVDMVVTDIRMPRLDGVSLLKKVRVRYGDKLPVVLISGYSDFTESDAISLGAFAFLQKPFDWDHLIALVADVRAKKHSSDA